MIPASDPAYLPRGSLLTGRYEILGEIGRGGYSVVYAARDREVGTDVAIKLLVPSPAVAHLARERMRREVQAVRGLSHANIVAVHDFLEEGPWSFIVMEQVPGPDLHVRVRERGPLGAEEAVSVGSGIADALAAAHRRGILHRDVKPQNILLDPRGQARLTDFGSARLEGQVTVTQTGAFVGTLAYAAPEVIAGRRGDARSDIYALGMTLYFALTGKLPASASPHLPPTPMAGGHHPRGLRRDIPAWLDETIARATAADPGDRFHAASSLAEALAEGTSGRPMLTRRPAYMDFCLNCGAIEPLGLRVCPHCGGIPQGPADALVFLERPASKLERRATLESLAEVFTGLPRQAELREVAWGERALVRVPSATAEKIVTHLGLRGIQARTAPVGHAWALVPPAHYRLAGLILVVGTAAGMLALPALLWTSPMVAGLLVLSGHRTVQRPALHGLRRPTQLPPELETRVTETMAGLPEGTARSLLVDLLRMGQLLFPRLSETGAHGPAVDQLTELLSRACDAAVDLANLDENLTRFDAQRERFVKLPPTWMDGLSQCERARDRLVQYLLEVVTVMMKARGLVLQSPDTAGVELRELARGIETELAAHAEAAQEIEELLATP